MKSIHVLRKPCSEGTVAANVIRYGTGGINIDGCRVEGVPPSVPQPAFNSPTGRTYGMKTGVGRNGETSHAQGRWPANLVMQHLDGCVQDGVKDGTETVTAWTCEPGCPVAGLDAQSGVQKSGVAVQRHGGGQKIGNIVYRGSARTPNKLVRDDAGFGDTGGASRFFKQVGGKVGGEE